MDTGSNHRICREVDGLKIIEHAGVCPVLRESECLLKYAARETASTVLDMGTGTGYIAISMAKKGFQATGVDIDPLAIKTAMKNAALNSVNIGLFKSDLFSGVKDRYDIIIFNAPTIANNMSLYRLILLFNRLFPAGHRDRLSLLHELPIIKSALFKSRKALIFKFLAGCGEHLNPLGRVFMLASPEDLEDAIIPYCNHHSLKIGWEPVAEVLIKRYIVRIDF